MEESGGVGDITKVSFYVDMIKGGDAGSVDEEEEEDDWGDEEEEDAGMVLDQPYDAELDQVEQEAAGM